MSQSKAKTDKKQSEKNIREIYLNAVKNDKGFYQRNKKKNISNLPKSSSDASFNASSYLEKEYTLVKRIISDTKELKTIKTKNDAVNGKSEFMAAPATSRPTTASSYKSPEDFSREVLELKKTLRVYQDNEVINKTKFEYYDNELAKKEQEIIDLLENKKNEELRINSDSKSDLLAFIYSLKQKIHRLEFAFKRKESELNKLQSEIKTTNMKELKCQNERLRLELGKSLMNDAKIIEAFEKEGIVEKNGFSFYDSDKRKSESELSLHKKEKLKEEIAQELNQDQFEDEEQFRAALKNFKKKMPLKGTLKQKLEILDLRENELLKEIERLNDSIEKKDIDDKLRRSSSLTSLRRDHGSRRSISPLESDKRTRSVEKIQSILRGHLERVNSLNRSQERQRRRSDDFEDENQLERPSSRISLRGSRRSLNGQRDDSIDRHRDRKEEMMRQQGKTRPPARHSPIEEPPFRSNRGGRVGRNQPIDSGSSDISTARSEKSLIEDKNSVSEVDTKGGCCGRFKSSKQKKK